MELIHTGEIFVAKSTFEERHIPKAAGFRWNPKDKCWWTDDIEKASKLVEYASNGAKEAIEAHKAKQAESRELSRANNADIEIPVPAGLNYLPYQKAAIAYAMQRPSTLFADEMGLGKAQPLDAKILTPAGWKRMGDIQVGDYVIGSNGKPTCVIGVFPQGKKEIFRVTFNDGSSTECCDDHLWTVNTPTRRLYGSGSFVLPLSEIRNNLTDTSGNRRYHIPMVQPVEFPEQNLPLDPYLLGVLLGDGSFCNGSVHFSKDDQGIIDAVSVSLPEGVIVKHISAYDYGIVSPRPGAPNPVHRQLKSIGLAGLRGDDKFIPDIYLIGSIEQRLAILNGLLDTDGYCSKDGTVQFSSNSLALADGVTELVQSLGGNARRSQKISASGKDHYLVTIALPSGIFPFRASRKRLRYSPRKKYLPTRAFAKVESVGYKEAQCIRVDAPDQLYVTDQYIVTHNTIQAIGVINADPTVKRVLIVCPASLKINWLREFTRWSVRSYSIGIANGGKFPTDDVVICNYDILTKNLKAIQAVQWDVLIADECHYAKNKKAQRSKALYAIEAKRRLFLTGTPIVNRPVELFPIVNALDPKTFGNFMQYAKRYCDAVRTRFGWDFSGASNLEELQDKLRTTIMVRRLKKDVLTELPAKRRQVIEFPANGCAAVIRSEMDAAARHEETLAILRARVALADAADDEEGYKNAVEELRHGTRTAFTEMSQLRHETAVAKIPYVIEHVRECVESSGKVIVFAHHLDVLNALTEAFGNEAVCLQGCTPQKERQEAVDRFQNDPAVKVFVGSITAAGVGITLTASSHVIFAELDWVPGNVTQAEDRAHRIGQQNSVLVQHLVLEGSLDATMARTIVAKQEAIDGALNNQYNVDEIEYTALREIRSAAADAEAEAKWNAEHPKPERKPRQKKQRAVEVFTETQIAAMNTALMTLAGMCDGAETRDNVGFNKFDAFVGRSLAMGGIHTSGQAELAKSILKKYHRQIGDGLMSAIYGDNWRK